MRKAQITTPACPERHAALLLRPIGAERDRPLAVQDAMIWP